MEDIQRLLAEERKEETEYISCNVPLSLYDSIEAVRGRAGLNRSEFMRVAFRLLIEKLDGGGPGPQPSEAETIAEGGEGIEG